MTGSNRVWLLLAAISIPLVAVASLLYGQGVAAQLDDVAQAIPSQEHAESMVFTADEIDASAAITTFTYLPVIQNGGSGKYITVLVPGGQYAAAQLREATKDFSLLTGHGVLFEGVDDFETTIVERVISGRAPDLAFFPQPGLLADLVAAGYTVDLHQWLSHSYLQQQYEKSWLDMATVNGQMAGVWYRASVKSLVWYPVPEFEDAGYTIPQDWDDLITLSNQIVSNGGTPWCIGIESGLASGWVGTDWVEDIMLRTTTPANYDSWVRGDLPFSSDIVSDAFQIMGGIWFTDDYVLGGRTGIQNTFIGDAPGPMFDEPSPQPVPQPRHKAVRGPHWPTSRSL